MIRRTPPNYRDILASWPAPLQARVRARADALERQGFPAATASLLAFERVVSEEAEKSCPACGARSAPR